MVATTLDDRIADRMRSPDFRAWRAKVETVGGCLQPVRLSGTWAAADTATGQVLAQSGGEVFAPCGNRRATVCPACSDRYAADAFHLLRAGLSGGAKDVPEVVRDRPRVFATLTAPSFGPVHSDRRTQDGKRRRCGCGTVHHPADSTLGTPLRPDAYDYTGAVLWQANAGTLWHRFVMKLRRVLAHAGGIKARDFKNVARVSYAKVAEYQRRGLVHFHAVIRVDGPDGPHQPPPGWLTVELLEHAISTAAALVLVKTVRPDGRRLDLVWGRQVDVRPITTEQARAVEDADGSISEAKLANYIAKYATKGTGATDGGVDRPIRSQRHLDALTGISAHHRRMIQTAWDLGDRDAYKGLNLRRWAHMLAFRGHFLTKSRHYSTTFGRIRDDRRTWRQAESLTALGLDPDTVAVIGHWNFTAVGHRDLAEREIASGIAERRRALRAHRHLTERDTTPEHIDRKAA